MAPGDRNRSKSVAEVNYIGVQKRYGGRYGAAIRDRSIKRRRWLGTFNTGEEAARAYDNAARNLKGDKAKTNFPAPSPHLDTVHIQRCTTADTTRLRTLPPANHGNNNISPSGTTISIPNNLIDYAILLQQQPLWGGIVGPQIIKKPNGHEWVGAGVVKNILPTASLQTRVCDSCDSSSSSAVDTQLSSLDLNPATKERATHRSFDLNLPAPGEEDDEDQCSPSLSFSLGPKH